VSGAGGAQSRGGPNETRQRLRASAGRRGAIPIPKERAVGADAEQWPRREEVPHSWSSTRMHRTRAAKRFEEDGHRKGFTSERRRAAVRTPSRRGAPAITASRTSSMDRAAGPHDGSASPDHGGYVMEGQAPLVRKHFTATSLAALRTAGAVPPRRGRDSPARGRERSPGRGRSKSSLPLRRDRAARAAIPTFG
jgi:hypothetical protein